MKRGRPSDDYPRDEFRQLILSESKSCGLSLVGLAKRAHIRRGTLSQVISGKRPCSRNDRSAIIHTLGLGSATERYFGLPSADVSLSNLDQLYPATSLNPRLALGQRSLICGMFVEALDHFRAVYYSAVRAGELALRADAATWIAWVHFEGGQPDESLEWIQRSIDMVEAHFGAKVAEIVASLAQTSHSAICTPEDDFSSILSRALHLKCKLLVEAIVHREKWGWQVQAQSAFMQSIAIDRKIGNAVQLGHDFRWHAVLIASSVAKKADRLLAESRERFANGSHGEAYWHRDAGRVSWLTDRIGNARRSLLDGVDALAQFDDVRALGPAFSTLTQVLVRGGGDRRQARRFAMAGAVLHPHGFVLDVARDQISSASPAGLRKDAEDLLAGVSPFTPLLPLMKHLTTGSKMDAFTRIQRNLGLVLKDKIDLAQMGVGDSI